MGAKTASRLGAALRSWLREERSSGPLSAGQQLVRRLAVALGLLGVGLVLQLQVQHQQRGRLADQQEALSILRAKVLASKQTARDWAQWTEMYDYVARPAAQPTFPDRKIRTANQFAAGGTMLAFNLQNRLLFSADRHGLNRPETQRLASCIQPALAQLISVQDALFFLCDNGRGVPYVGAVTPITDSQATAAANGALAYLVPLEDELIPERSRRLLRQLRHDLYALPNNQTQPRTGLIQPLRPQLQQRLLAADGRRLWLRTPPRWQALPAALLQTAAALAVAGAIALAGRILWMLERRRQRMELSRRSQRARIQQRRHQAEQQQRLIEGKLTSSLTAAVMAHEIQQPLSTILLQCQLAMQELEGSAAVPRPQPGAGTAAATDRLSIADRLRALSAEANRAVQITETMRMLLRNVNTPHTTVLLNDVIESALLFFNRAIQKHQISLQSLGLDQPTLIMGDATQVQSAIVNLIENAIQAMTTAPGRRAHALRLCLETVSDANGSGNGTGAAAAAAVVRFRLADSGPGFGQADADSALPLNTSNPHGSGLGLFVVRTTMRNHGGALRIGRSAELGGAEVELLWPAAKASAELSSRAAG
ncbi:MAG: CHASE4 domain-containing protein [Chitinophagaceae bacterium]|nr:CHASE4 domain-containing protein [Chitinophagaceae bacterium]